MKKIYKIILLSMGVLIFLLVAGTNLFLKGIVISSLEDTLSRKVSMGSLWLNPFTGTLSSHDVIIWNGEEEPLLSLESIEVNADPLKLFERKLSISEVRLIEPTLNLIGLGNDSKAEKESSPQTEEEDPGASSQGFIREVEIKNIAVERLTFIRAGEILKSMNTITFRVPDFTYENNELDLSASLNILGSGLLDIKIKANTETGILDTSLASEGFEFTNTFSPDEEDELKLSGNLNGKIFLQGNYLKKEFQVRGNVSGSKVLAEDKKGNQLLNSESIIIDLASLTFPEISLNLKKLEIEDTQSNLSILQEEKAIPLPEEKQQVKSLPAEERAYLLKDIIIGEITVKRSSLTYGDLAFTDIDLSLKDLRNIPENKASASASFTLNDSIDFSSQSLVEVLDYSTSFDPLKSLILKGSFILDTPSWELPDSVKKTLSYEAEVKKVNLKGDYSFSYPRVILKSDILSENLKLIGKKETFHDILLKSLYGNCSLAYNLDDSSYSLSGPLNLKDFNIKNKKGQDFFMGDLSVELGGLSKEMITLDSVILNSFFLDLNTKISPEESKNFHGEETGSGENSPPSKEEAIEVVIGNLKLRSGRVLTKDLSFEKVYLDGNNVSNKKINSNFVLDALMDGFTPLKGDLNVKVNDMDTFSDLKAKGNISVSNLDLKILNSYTKDFPYEIRGIVNYSSFLDYSKDNISSKGDFSGSNLRIKKPESMDISVENIRSKLNFNFKKEGIFLSNSSFSLSNLKGEIQDETKVQLAKGDIVVKEYSPKIIQFSSISLTSPLIDLKESPEEAGGSGGSSDQKKEDEQPLPVIFASKINVKNGKVIYRGLEKTSVYENIGFSAANFTTQKNKNSSIDAGLSLAGIQRVELKGNLSLKEDWDFSPKTITFSGTLNVTNLNIPTFNNILQKNLPNEFDGGILSSRGRVNLRAAQLNSEHDITISKVDLGKTTGYSRGIPLGSVIKVLSDRYGNIRITLPVTGDLTNPKLGITSIVTSSIMSGLVKAARSPQTIISKVLTLGDDEIKTIYFNYLSGEPNQPETDKLSEIINILTENPKHKVTFTLYTNENVEISLLTTKSITGILLGQKMDPERTLENLMEERKKYILDFFSDRVSSERIEVKVSKENKSLPQAEVEFKE
ncbi:MULTISPECIES: DUF748 domain-containing protein [Psychrilyobacter]|uniref:DUF748 domain-containing protein n=1 Tax=Psychrilyobacter piezotolerans TaxID=2293438 RepID=A0ABX9KFT2_9FUSO|nr:MULTISPECIES: DUF748 domain-containing protein [Psychrilyobacter]MCS5420974.1 DUF748 domain-containing protein [Psychrilyobacter sp. S5]NDI78775.1 DUF748 domain-containing protein [Psychrilyobacter piezotolerans]RDE60876.1 DUF748 domain-containing protein [Psychrilyobacter sp. S5]REI40665.1 DUF748 domain-containing protein [Psychrilyobacter piezotolerans]